MPTKVVEYMARGVPVVTTRCPPRRNSPAGTNADSWYRSATR